MPLPRYEICVLPGDGIGVEVIDAALPLLERAGHGAGFALRFGIASGGRVALQGHRRSAARRDAGRCARSARDPLRRDGLAPDPPSRRHRDRAAARPALRSSNSTRACVPRGRCPASPLPLADPRARDIDLVIVRESTEGLFASVGRGTLTDDREARDTMVITRKGSERVHEFAFRLAQRRRARGRPGEVTCVDKANVFRSMAFFRKVFDEVAARHPAMRARHHYVDATALDLVRRPWTFDVLVTENMFGDILSDEAAGLVGGMGMAPSADIGDEHGLFQPCHGSAPDIAGQGKANPTAMILSAAMMLDWLGRAARRPASRRGRAAHRDRRSTRHSRPAACLPIELGGRDGTAAIASAVADNL